MNSCRWVPWAVAAALAVVALVNVAFAYFAVSSSPGLVTDHPFTEGNSYNRVIAAAAAQDALGWRASLAFEPARNEEGEIVVRFSDRAGKPLAGLKVSAIIARPVEPLPEIRVPLSEAGAGRYEGHLAVTRHGQWEVHVAARRGAEGFQFAKRIVVE